ncbi:MAG TPA: chorismate synthase [Chlamydiales bacterium]|nr:chorismate synthase [Chlamydiales bacterium]
MNTFGNLFRITTFGESHGPAIGVVIDGCPAGIELTIDEINHELFLRSPGRNLYVSPRKEEDVAEILSGIFEGKTTGAPIAILIRNKDADSSQYANLKDLYRPGHANFTYLQKYGIFDYRGGGRASARETAARVAAGAVAKKFLKSFGIDCVSYLDEMGAVAMPEFDRNDLLELREKTLQSPIFCPCPITQEKMLEQIQKDDSLGGIVAGIAHVPVGLGEPVYGKLEACLAFAMLSIPASKGFEIGKGFAAAKMRGSEHNDPFVMENGKVRCKQNFAGGTLGGISTGEPLYFRVAFKPTSSIKKVQETVSLNAENTLLQLPNSARHDPCIAIRAVPVVEAMTALVIADALLLNQINMKSFARFNGVANGAILNR